MIKIQQYHFLTVHHSLKNKRTDALTGKYAGIYKRNCIRKSTTIQMHFLGNLSATFVSLLGLECFNYCYQHQSHRLNTMYYHFYRLSDSQDKRAALLYDDIGNMQQSSSTFYRQRLSQMGTFWSRVQNMRLPKIALNWTPTEKRKE